MSLYHDSPRPIHPTRGQFFVQTTPNAAAVYHSTLLEVAAVEDEAVYQDFVDPSNHAPIHFPAGHDVLPRGWSMTGMSDYRVDIRHGVATEVALPASHAIGKDGFGDHSLFDFSVPVPHGFHILNITDDKNDGKGSGYDAYAIVDDRTHKLIIVNKGADSVDPSNPNTLDLQAAFHDGGAQVKDAIAFLENTLGKLGYAPSSITFTGHSLGAPLAVAQAADLAKYHANIPFNVITFDSIGDAPMLEQLGVSKHILNEIKEHHLSIRGSGEVVLEGQDTGFNAHLFREISASFHQDFGSAAHDMTNFTPKAFAEVEHYPLHHDWLV